MLVLQSSSNPQHILPSSSSETNATSGGVSNFNNVEVEEDVDVIEEMFISLNEDVHRGIKQEEIPRDIILPDIKSEPHEVSYFCSCLLLDTFYQVGRWEGGSVGGRVCTGWVCGREGLYWMGRWEVGSVLFGLVGLRVRTGWVGGREGLYWLGQWEGGSVLVGSVGGKVCTGWVGGRKGLYWMGGWEGRSVLGGSVGQSLLDVLVGGTVFSGWVLGREGLYWMGRWEGRSVLGGSL